MRILAVKPGHDGHIAHIVDGRLEFSLEAEKDSGVRYASVDVSMMLDVLRSVEQLPDVIALSGWSAGADPTGRSIGAGYLGIESASQAEASLLGRSVKIVSSSHERSHLLSSYAMSPFPQRQPCYALVWEGHIGAFYSIDENVQITRLADIMRAPGIRYAFAYAVADPSFHLPAGCIRLGDAGKLMALAAFEDVSTPRREELDLVSRLLRDPLGVPKFRKADFREYSCFDSGVESVASKRIARLVSDHIYRYFETRIRDLVTDPRPLLISGGCGLNCDWNRAWLDSGLFTDVFVPPCANDTGSAIGTGVDAQFLLNGNAKLDWDVYRGAPFVDDADVRHHPTLGGFRRQETDYAGLAERLATGAILGWVCGRTELGPRALGNRSILAAPFSKNTLKRLNHIKRREPFRPIAPICLEEDLDTHFELQRPSPHMLYFAKVKTGALQAVTHVDGSARVQTVNREQNAPITELLQAFRRRTGFGVLCNTSLNFNGAGFINRTSDLVRYAEQAGLDGFVVQGQLFMRDADHAGGER